MVPARQATYIGWVNVAWRAGTKSATLAQPCLKLWLLVTPLRLSSFSDVSEFWKSNHSYRRDHTPSHPFLRRKNNICRHSILYIHGCNLQVIVREKKTPWLTFNYHSDGETVPESEREALVDSTHEQLSRRYHILCRAHFFLFTRSNYTKGKCNKIEQFCMTELRRRGKNNLLYWITTISTSTSTSFFFTSTVSFVNAYCTPTNFPYAQCG